MNKLKLILLQFPPFYQNYQELAQCSTQRLWSWSLSSSRPSFELHNHFIVSLIKNLSISLSLWEENWIILEILLKTHLELLKTQKPQWKSKLRNDLLGTFESALGRSDHFLQLCFTVAYICLKNSIKQRAVLYPILCCMSGRYKYPAFKFGQDLLLLNK